MIAVPAKAKASAVSVSLVSNERIDARVLLVRGQKVLLDADLTKLYGVLKSQTVISKTDGRGGRRTLPVRGSSQPLI